MFSDTRVAQAQKLPKQELDDLQYSYISISHPSILNEIITDVRLINRNGQDVK